MMRVALGCDTPIVDESTNGYLNYSRLLHGLYLCYKKNSIWTIDFSKTKRGAQSIDK